MDFANITNIMLQGMSYGMLSATTASLLGYGVNKLMHMLDISKG